MYAIRNESGSIYWTGKWYHACDAQNEGSPFGKTLEEAALFSSIGAAWREFVGRVEGGQHNWLGAETVRVAFVVQPVAEVVL